MSQAPEIGSWAQIAHELREREFSAAGYLAAWKLVRAVPTPVARGAADLAADLISDEGRGMEQLRKNLTRVVGAENVTRELVRDSMRSYARYWREAFMLPSIADDPRHLDRLTEGMVGREAVDKSIESGRGVIWALPHSGNWDMAGHWLVATYGGFATVAERLKPETLYQAFVGYRESLGFEVIPLTGGEVKPFVRLKEVLNDGGIVCLMGERDLSRHGVEVDFFGEKSTIPAGPAKLAMETGAALHVAHSWFYTDDRGDGWGLSSSDEIEVTTVEETTQRLADEFAANIVAHPADWHMLQAQWRADLPPRA